MDKRSRSNSIQSSNTESLKNSLQSPTNKSSPKPKSKTKRERDEEKKAQDEAFAKMKKKNLFIQEEPHRAILPFVSCEDTVLGFPRDRIPNDVSRDSFHNRIPNDVSRESVRNSNYNKKL